MMIITTEKKRFLIDGWINGYLCLRPVVDGVAYWPGKVISIIEADRQIFGDIQDDRFRTIAEIAGIA